MEVPAMEDGTALDELREQYPDWKIREDWLVVASGPDRKRYVASRACITVTAWTVEDLARAIRQTAGGAPE
jgi:hypothetical protein